MSGHRCPDLNQYVAWLGASKPPPAELSTHLAACERCRTEWEAGARIGRLLMRDAHQVPMPATNEMAARLMLRQHLRAEIASRSTQPRHRPAWRALGLAAAGAALALLGLHAAIGFRPPAPAEIADRVGGAFANRNVVNRFGQSQARVAQPTSAVRTGAAESGLPASCPFHVSPTSADHRTGIRISAPIPRPGSHRAPTVWRDDMAYLNPLVSLSAAGSARRSSASNPAPAARAPANPSIQHPSQSAFSASHSDDFIAIPLPQIAAADTPDTRRLIAQAIDRYSQEKAVVDPRLQQKVDVSLKAGDLQELMSLLAQKTGVHFYVAKDIADLKLTVLVNQTPARDIMRQVVRLFNLEWHRNSVDVQGARDEGRGAKDEGRGAKDEGRGTRDEGRGKEGRPNAQRLTPNAQHPTPNTHYTYSLVQTLKQKLAEEELKRADEDQMVLNVADEMDRYKPYVGASSDEMKAKAEEAKARAQAAGTVEERDRWQQAAQMFDQLSRPDGMAALQLYSGLTPDQMVALRNGSRISFGTTGLEDRPRPPGGPMKEPEAAGPALPLPESLAAGIRSGLTNLRMMSDDGPMSGPGLPADLGQAKASIGFWLDRSHPDRAELMASWGIQGSGIGLVMAHPFASGQPNLLQAPTNVADHAALRSSPAYEAKATLDPKPEQMHQLAPDSGVAAALQRRWEDTSRGNAGRLKDSREWIDSADIFSELHQTTGRPIIADYYLRVYPRADFQIHGAKLLDVLNNTANALKSDWQDEGGFWRFRRYNYYSQREIDVPNQLLKKWKEDRQRRGALDLDDLCEISGLRDTVLNDDNLQSAVVLKWSLEEWPTAAMGRQELRFYAGLDAAQRAQIQSVGGLAYGNLSPAQFEAAPKFMGAMAPMDSQAYKSARIFLRLSPAGYYTWVDRQAPGGSIVFPGAEPVREKTRAKAEAAAAAYLKAHRASDQEVAAEGPVQVDGPDPRLWLRIQVGDQYRETNTSVNGTLTTGSTPPGPGGRRGIVRDITRR